MNKDELREAVETARTRANAAAKAYADAAAEKGAAADAAPFTAAVEALKAAKCASARNGDA